MLTWNAEEVDRFLAASADHRWAIGFRLGVLYGLRRSEVLAPKWDDLDTDAQTLRIDESLVAVRTGAACSNAKSERSRHVIPLDDDTTKALIRRRAEQAAERLKAGGDWDDDDVIITTRLGRLVLLRSHDRALERVARTPACHA